MLIPTIYLKRLGIKYTPRKNNLRRFMCRPIATSAHRITEGMLWGP